MGANFQGIAPELTKIFETSTSLVVPRRAHYIYFLMLREQIVYVGKSNKILSRISQHTREKDFDSVRYVGVDKEDQDSLEMALIFCLKPKYNKQNLSKISDSQAEVLKKYNGAGSLLYQILNQMPAVEEGEYGAVGWKRDGLFAIAYYDNDEVVCDEGYCEHLNEEMRESGWTEDDGCTCETLAIVYTGKWSAGYHMVPHRELKQIPRDNPKIAEMIKELDGVILEGFRGRRDIMEYMGVNV